MGAAATSIVLATSAAAFAQGTSASMELTLLHGTNQSSPSVPQGWPELSGPPWNAYNHYEVVSTKTLTLNQGTPVKEALPDGSSLEATLVATTPKYKLELVLKDSKGKQVSKGDYSWPKGKRVLPVSTPYKGGNLVVALKVL